MSAPQTIHIIFRVSRTDYDDTWQPWGVSFNGEITPWAEAAVTMKGSHVEVNGQLYRRQRKYGERVRDGFFYQGYTYCLMVGYNVLASTDFEGRPGPFVPEFQHPVDTFSEAEEKARWLVTTLLAGQGTPLHVQIVPQRGLDYGEPVGELDGRQYTRYQAARTLLSGDYFPLDWTNDEAGNAPTSPASRSIPSDDDQEPTQADDTIIRDLAQVRHVSPQWGAGAGTNAQVNGRNVAWDERPFEEVEAMVKSLGWRPMGKQGGWWNPKFDAEAERNRQEWERDPKAAARAWAASRA